MVDMLSEQLKRVNRTWMYILAGVLALIVRHGRRPLLPERRRDKDR